jgi:hypothetical protein
VLIGRLGKFVAQALIDDIVLGVDGVEHLDSTAHADPESARLRGYYLTTAIDYLRQGRPKGGIVKRSSGCIGGSQCDRYDVSILRLSPPLPSSTSNGFLVLAIIE